MKRLLPIAAGLLIAISASSVPALKRPFNVTQPDGTTITLIQNGDEFYHFITTEDGIPVKLCDDNFYRYINNDGFTISSVIARNPKERTSTDLSFLKSTDSNNIKKIYSKIHEEKFWKVNSNRTNAFKSVKEEEVVDALVILVEFADNSFKVSKSELENMLNQEGFSKYGSIGSAKDYFHDQSNGKFTMNFNVVGPVKLSNNLKYYGENDQYGNDFRAPEMIKEACEEAAKTGLDFSKFDRDGDKVVDLVYVVYAGYGENACDNPDLVWPHAHSLSYEKLDAVINGYTIDRYACSAELNNNPELNRNNEPCGIGTFCHEFTHTLGLPDWYNTTYGTNVVREWSLMDYGCYNNDSYVPVGFSAYEKEFVGWMDIEELDSPKTVTLEPIVDSNKAYKIVNDKDKNECIVLENRIKKGWDMYIAAEGLMATAVAYNKDAWESNKVNNESNKRYCILPADNTNDAKSSEGDLYPYNGNNRISDYSTPSSITYSGAKLGKPVTGITKNSDKSITFNFMGGDNYERKDITANEATAIRETQFVANWEKVSGITQYTLYVNKLNNGEIVSTQEYNVSDNNKLLLRNMDTNTIYTYYVIGVDSETDMLTNPSNEIKVVLGTVGIEDGYSNDEDKIYSTGNTINIQSNSGNNFEVYDITGYMLTNGKTENGTTAIKVEKSGLYIVKLNDKVVKLIVR